MQVRALDLRVRLWPESSRAEHASERGLVLGAFEFHQDPPCRATLSGRGERARWVLRARSGAEFELRREGADGR